MVRYWSVSCPQFQHWRLRIPERLRRPLFLLDMIEFDFLNRSSWGYSCNLDLPIAEIDHSRKRSYADIEVVNQEKELVGVGRHILQWVPNSSSDVETQ